MKVAWVYFFLQIWTTYVCPRFPYFTVFFLKRVSSIWIHHYKCTVVLGGKLLFTKYTQLHTHTHNRYTLMLFMMVKDFEKPLCSFIVWETEHRFWWEEGRFLLHFIFYYFAVQRPNNRETFRVAVIFSLPPK